MKDQYIMSRGVYQGKNLPEKMEAAPIFKPF
jgi:hypothetical protein